MGSKDKDKPGDVSRAVRQALALLRGTKPPCATPTLDTVRDAAAGGYGWKGNAADVRALLREIGDSAPEYEETVEEEADRLTDCEP